MAKSFAVDIKPLFRREDLACMARLGVFLEDPEFMCDPAGSDAYEDHANARTVFARLTQKEAPMPPDGRWPQAKLDVFATWMSDGFAQ